jgi:hypothetical protein
MIVEEYVKTLGLLHPLEGLELLLSVLKDRARRLEPQRRGDMLQCLQSADKMRQALLASVQSLLGESERIEDERRSSVALMCGQAKAQGRSEALDLLSETIAGQRASGGTPPKYETLRVKGKDRR